MQRINQIIIIFILIGAACVEIYSQSPSKIMQPGYYVVVAAYSPSKESYAQRYIEKLKKEGYSASYGFDTIRSFYYVYLSYHTKLKDGLLEMQSVRKAGKFTDAWIRIIPGKIKMDIQPESQEKSQQNDSTNKEGKDTVTINKNGVFTDTLKDSDNDLRSDSVIRNEPVNEIILREGALTLANSEVFLSLYNARNDRIIDGKVSIIDTENARLIEQAPGNSYIRMPDPKSKSGRITLIGEVFGYRKIQHELNFNTTMADTTLNFVDLVGTTYVINFDMVRYRRGDIATLYNVYFYNDAAIMLPESRYELNSLLELLRENKDYRIKLHGHSNGNYFGKIVSMGSDQNFFSLKGDVKSGVGSAKHLSELRAAVIKDWLVAQGIDASRIEVKGWGGKRPIYDRNGPNAKKNVRVEVEILND